MLDLGELLDHTYHAHYTTNNLDKLSRKTAPSARANALKRLTQLIPRTQKRKLKTTTSPTRDTGAIEMTTYNPLVARKTTSPAEDDLKREPEEVISPLSAHIKDRLGFTESLKSKKQIEEEQFSMV